MKIEAGEAFEGGKDSFAKEVKETAERVKKWTEEGNNGFGFGFGVFVRIVTDGDKVTEIRVTGGGRKK